MSEWWDFFAYNEHTRKGYIILYRKYVQKYYSYSMGMSVVMSKTHVQLFTLHENFSQVMGKCRHILLDTTRFPPSFALFSEIVFLSWN